MIKITNETQSGKINIVGLSISTNNEKNFIEIKMSGDEERITQMIVNTVKDGLDDVGTKKTTEKFINILANSIVGICVEQDDNYLASTLIENLKGTLKE